MDYVPSHAGLAAMLKGPEMRALVNARALVGARWARAHAPVGPPRDPHRGELRDSVHVVTGGMSLKGDRVAANLVADSSDAVANEFGNRRRRGAHTLRSAIPIIEQGHG